LRARGQTLSVAESCTGGLVSDRITDSPGSSDYFKGGIVSYSIEAKTRHLDIPLRLIKRYGVVSPQVARRMAEGARKAFQTTYGLSTTGVAGPTGGSRNTPVGTVFIGFSDEKNSLAIKERFKGNRRQIKEQAAERALQLLYEKLCPGTADCELRMADCIRRTIETEESTILLVHRAARGILREKGRLGIFPASFNPPTMAHLALIREAKKISHLDEILLLLDVRAMDKGHGEAKFEDRLQMVKMVFQKDPEISIGLSNRGRFLEKLKPLRDLYPPPVQSVFIVGFDTILRVLDKKYYRNRTRALDQLFEQCRFLVANRGPQEREAFLKLFHHRENNRYRDKVSFFALSSKFSTLSSTMVRERISQGRPVGKRVPASALRFIREKGLYQARRRRGKRVA